MLDNFFLNLPKILTERLILRKLSYEDRESIFEYARNPLVAEHVIWGEHKNITDTIAYLNVVYDAYNNNRAAPWGIQLKEDNKIIGTVGFVDIKPDKKEAEIGYALSYNYWNKGIITESVTKVIQIGFEKLNFSKITARCKPINKASKKVLEKCGLRFTKRINMAMKIKGEFEDLDYYEITFDEFIKNQKSK